MYTMMYDDVCDDVYMYLPCMMYNFEQQLGVFLVCVCFSRLPGAQHTQFWFLLGFAFCLFL